MFILGLSDSAVACEYGKIRQHRAFAWPRSAGPSAEALYPHEVTGADIHPASSDGAAVGPRGGRRGAAGPPMIYVHLTPLPGGVSGTYHDRILFVPGIVGALVFAFAVLAIAPRADTRSRGGLYFLGNYCLVHDGRCYSLTLALALEARRVGRRRYAHCVPPRVGEGLLISRRRDSSGRQRSINGGPRGRCDCFRMRAGIIGHEVRAAMADGQRGGSLRWRRGPDGWRFVDLFRRSWACLGMKLRGSATGSVTRIAGSANATRERRHTTSAPPSDDALWPPMPRRVGRTFPYVGEYRYLGVGPLGSRPGAIGQVDKLFTVCWQSGYCFRGWRCTDDWRCGGLSRRSWACIGMELRGSATGSVTRIAGSANATRERRHTTSAPPSDDAALPPMLKRCGPTAPDVGEHLLRGSRLHDWPVPASAVSPMPFVPASCSSHFGGDAFVRPSAAYRALNGGHFDVRRGRRPLAIMATIVLALFLVHRRIGEASNPGPCDDREREASSRSGPYDAMGLDVFGAAVKKARNALATALAGEVDLLATVCPRLVDGSACGGKRPVRRRPRIQPPMDQRALKPPRAPVPLGLAGWSTAPAATVASTSMQCSGERSHRGGRMPRGRRAGARVRRGRGEALSAAAARGSFKIFLGNITCWSEAARDYVFGLDADALLLAEVHVKSHECKKVLSPAGLNGWNITLGPAKQSALSESGSNGGVASLVHKRWHSSAWTDTVDRKGHIGPFFDLVGRTVQLDEVEVGIMVAYFDCKEGVSGSNLDILGRVEARTGAGRDPFLLAADFNATPEELGAAAGDWLTRNKATIVRAHNLSITCRAGAEGSLIDYFIVSERLVGAIKSVWVDVSTPWWPHYGVVIELHCRPTEVLARQLEHHRAFVSTVGAVAEPRSVDGARDHSSSGGARAGTPDVAAVSKVSLWRRAWEIACSAAASTPLTEPVASAEQRAVVEYMNALDIAPAALDAGRRYGTWRHALVLYCEAADRSGCELIEGSTVGDERGGSGDTNFDDEWFTNPAVRPPTFPSVSRCPVVKRSHNRKRGGLNNHTRGGGGPVETRLLRTLRQWLVSLGKWSRASNFASNHTARYVIKMTARLVGGWTPPAKALLEGLGEADAAALVATAAPPLVEAWRGQVADMGDAIKLVDGLLEKALAIAKDRRKRDFDDWLARALADGAKAAHRYVGRDSRPPPLELTIAKRIGDGREVTSDPDVVAEHYAEPWRAIWGCGDDARAAEELAMMRRRRSEALGDCRTYASHLLISPNAIRTACRTFKKGTSIGADDVLFEVMARLPDDALDVLGGLLRSVIAFGVLPPIALLNVLNLLGKKGGGSRTIATMASLYRLAMRLAGDDITDWDQAKAGHFDTAVSGSSALRAYLLRSLEVEVATSEGLSVGHLLWDMEKFYDSISLSRLLPRLELLGYPTALTTLGYVAHRAPRMVSTGISFSSMITGFSRSIIAGCQQSVSWTRGLLRGMVERLGYIIPGSLCYEHVDDLSQVVATHNGTALRKALVEIGLTVKEEVQRLELNLSSKSVALPKGDVHVEAAVVELRAAGVAIRTAGTADDLGGQVTAGRRRRVSTLRKRVGVAKVRAERIHHLAKRTRVATKLARPSLSSCQSYAHQGVGVSGTMLSDMRRAFKTASHLGGTRGCTTSILWWTYGAGADPAIRVPLEQLSEWIDAWLNLDDSMRQRVRRSWRNIMPTLVRDERRWKRANGFMSATICTLIDLGWKPSSPSHWRIDGDTMAVIDGAAFAKTQVLARAFDDISRQLARRAESHPSGAGIGDTVNFDGLRKARAVLLKNGEWAAARAIEHVAVGAVMEPEHGADVPPRPEHLCQRCDLGVPATHLHCYYLCPDNACVDGNGDDIDSDTKAIIEEAVRDEGGAACLWYRGIIPSAMVKPPPRPQFGEVRVRATPGLKSLLSRSRVGFSDGSGGSSTIHHRCRRAHCGAAAFEGAAGNDDITVEGLVAEVPGRQTVPRGELWAASLLLDHAPIDGDFRIVLDAAYVANGLGRRGDLVRGPNGDLWAILLQLVDERKGETLVSKVKSHVVRNDVEGLAAGRHDREHVLGNELADAAAETGEVLFANGAEDDSRTRKAVEAKACRVALRLARIQCRVWEVMAGAKIFEPPETQPIDVRREDKAYVVNDVLRGIAAKGHRLERCRGGFACSRCGVQKSWACKEYWTRIPCRLKMDAATAVKRLKTVHDAIADSVGGAGATLPAHQPSRAPTAAVFSDDASAGDPATDLPRRRGGRARWACLVDDDGTRRWVVKGCEAERRHVEGGGDVWDPHGEGAGTTANRGEGDDARETSCVLGNLGSASVGRVPRGSFDDPAGDAERDLDMHLDSLDGAATGLDLVNDHFLPQAAVGSELGLEGHVGPAVRYGGISETAIAASPPADTPPSPVRVADEHIERRVRRRICFKATREEAASLGHASPPAELSGEAALLSRGEFVSMRKRLRKCHDEHGRRAKVARDVAWAAVARNPDQVGAAAGEDDVVPLPSELVPKAWMAHGSHSLTAPGPELLYCAVCGAWSSGHKARGLVAECRGEVAHRGNMRLLKLGIAPVRGARLPPIAKRPGSKGTRGGATAGAAPSRRRRGVG